MLVLVLRLLPPTYKTAIPYHELDPEGHHILASAIMFMQHNAAGECAEQVCMIRLDSPVF